MNKRIEEQEKIVAAQRKKCNDTFLKLKEEELKLERIKLKENGPDDYSEEKMNDFFNNLNDNFSKYMDGFFGNLEKEMNKLFNNKK